MDTLDKVRFIESDAVPKEGASVMNVDKPKESITPHCAPNIGRSSTKPTKIINDEKERAENTIPSRR